MLSPLLSSSCTPHLVQHLPSCRCYTHQSGASPPRCPSFSTEKEEVHFLCVVCSKIKIDPYQVNFFISHRSSGGQLPKVKRKSPTSIDQIAEELDDLSVDADPADQIDVKTLDIDIEDDHHLEIYHQKREEFQLAESLLNLTKSPDQKIAVKACEGLMLLVGLPEARSARILVECTAFAQIMCSKGRGRKFPHFHGS